MSEHDQPIAPNLLACSFQPAMRLGIRTETSVIDRTRGQELIRLLASDADFALPPFSHERKALRVVNCRLMRDREVPNSSWRLGLDRHLDPASLELLK